MFTLGFSDLVVLITKKVISKPSMHADLTPIQNDPVPQDAITCFTAVVKMFLFITLDDVTDTVMPLKDFSYMLKRWCGFFIMVCLQQKILQVPIVYTALPLGITMHQLIPAS